MPGAIFKSVFYIHAEYILFSPDILRLKRGGAKKTNLKQPFQASWRKPDSVPVPFPRALRKKKNLFCMLRQLEAHTPELDMHS